MGSVAEKRGGGGPRQRHGHDAPGKRRLTLAGSDRSIESPTMGRDQVCPLTPAWGQWASGRAPRVNPPQRGLCSTPPPVPGLGGAQVVLFSHDCAVHEDNFLQGDIPFCSCLLPPRQCCLFATVYFLHSTIICLLLCSGTFLTPFWIPHTSDWLPGLCS